MYAQDNILCQFGPKNLSSVQQLISQPILIHFWWELYQNDEETTQMKVMTKNSLALQEALAGFFSITGQGMSAWMMQSMSNSTSDEIKKEYANEMMKQQILKICHDNVKMMKELTETELLSSSSSTPPVNDILCKSTNVKILSAPSLPTPGNENEKEKEEKEEDNEGEEDINT